MSVQRDRAYGDFRKVEYRELFHEVVNQMMNSFIVTHALLLVIE